MYYIVGLLIGCVLIKAYRDYRRMPNCTLIVYVLVLAVDLVVGCSIIVWKCSISKSEEECEMAAGGTVGSVVIWLLIMLVCPFFSACAEICVALDNLKKKCFQYMAKLRTGKSRDIVIQNDVHSPTTTALLDKVPLVDQRSKVYVFNETRGARDQTVKVHKTNRAGDMNGDRNQTTVIKYVQPDVP